MTVWSGGGGGGRDSECRIQYDTWNAHRAERGQERYDGDEPCSDAPRALSARTFSGC